MKKLTLMAVSLIALGVAGQAMAANDVVTMSRGATVAGGNVALTGTANPNNRVVVDNAGTINAAAVSAPTAANAQVNAARTMNAGAVTFGSDKINSKNYSVTFNQNSLNTLINGAIENAGAGSPLDSVILTRAQVKRAATPATRSSIDKIFGGSNNISVASLVSTLNMNLASTSPTTAAAGFAVTPASGNVTLGNGVVLNSGRSLVNGSVVEMQGVGAAPVSVTAPTGGTGTLGFGISD